MKRLLSVLFAIMLAGQAWASDFPIPLNTTSQGDKIKNKVIEYPQNGYVVNLMLQKKIIVVQKPISITDISNGKLILDGTVKRVDSYMEEGPYLQVRGIWTNKYGKIDGTFKVDNTNGKGFSLTPKKATDLSVTIEDIVSYAPNDSRMSISIVKNEKEASAIQYGKTYLLTIDNSNRDKSKIEIPLDRDVLLDSYNDIELLLLSAERAKITTTEYSFEGQVEPKKNGMFVDYIQKVGIRTYKTGPYKEMIIVKVGINYNVKLICADSRIEEETLSLHSSVFSKIEWWNIDEYLKNTKNIDIKYTNGDSFNGTFVVEKGMIQPQIGVYRYANGDVFKGDVAGKTIYGAFVEGTTTFADNSKSVSGDWLSKYQLSPAQTFEISNKKTPAEKRKYAEYYWSVKNGDNAYQSQKYEDAKRWYEQAVNSSPDDIDDKKLNERLKYINEEVEKEQRKKQLIAKYGQDNGTKIANGVLEIGMTKQMCEELIGSGGKFGKADQSLYRISKSRDYQGNSIEVWEYDPNKVLSALNGATNSLIDGSNSGEEVLAIALIQAIGGVYEGELKRLMRSEVKYKYIKFRNSTIVEIRDHSSYEDIDDSYNNIMNGLMWDY
ncbi:MAG: hypothetical protein J6W13_10915 [Salinivirgaceae bacterium]|nr:hypothetical protein [Salinivirgaceae bacterium]